jgi:uncharacterized YigZ family protein
MSYLTISQNSSSLFKEKGSKFLGYAISCSSEEAVKKQLELLRKEHPGACHVCYGLKLGFDGSHYRASDDGEPNNSAGQPILGQIHSFGVTQILVAVVRYYGGTNLGVGGLVQAYRTAAKEALEAAGLKKQEITKSYSVTCNYEQFPHLMNEIKARDLQITNQELHLNCRLNLMVDEKSAAEWEVILQHLEVKYEVE